MQWHIFYQKGRIMKTFFQWCEERKLEIPTVTETTPKEDAETSEGSGKRAAVRSHAYPELYGRGQYPKGYFNPTAADNMVYNKDK